MGKDYQGYNDILEYFKYIKSQMPKGISLFKRGNKLYFLFKTQYKKRSDHATGENFTTLGLNRCLEKAIQINEQLKVYESEIEFWAWYDETIKGINKNATNDLITVANAINKVESWFFSQNDRRGLQRSKETDYKSYKRAYGYYYQKILNQEKQVSYELLYDSLISYESDRETQKYQECLNAFLKLCEVNQLKTIYNKLSKLKLKTNAKKKNTFNREEQSISIEDFLKLRVAVLSIKDSHSLRENNRKFWLWVYSIQLVYGLRIAEVAAIKNLTRDYIPANDPQENSKDKTIFKALNNPDNKDNIIYIGNFTLWGNQKVKTGARIAMPLIPPTYPNIIDLLEIKNVPNFYHKSFNIYSRNANQRIEQWSTKFLGYKVSQTHTLRKLGNANGIQAGISDTVRCKSLGHSETVNAKYYQDFSGQTTIDLYKNAKRNPIPFETALKLLDDLPTNPKKEDLIKLLCQIYQLQYPD
ncbi:site-specific integrase [Cyanobacterium aponinum UTEX 3222]|uniref:site-specific integrase n=1 Tax=Cyanobacterium aponinum TaxID=379064 RepID=UPI002B4BEAB8|nr:site-specific integrase [Cyanobacterium aponinum]WRL38337.1 site-specific integrase [Cyanobacterium aponinum UTEX 3221]WRL41178.1 site-specific integrase [Cyanobacterium aponinum UTEX 3222]